MINQFILAGVGYAFMAMVSILDKFILDKSVKKPSVYTFYSTIFFSAAFLALPWTVSISPEAFIWSALSGLSFGFGMWAMFVALGKEGASHIVPFVGALVVVSSYFFSFFILGEVLDLSVKVGLLFLIGASVLLSFKQKKGLDLFGKNFLWASVAGIFFGLSHVAAKYIYGLYPFFTGLVWTKGMVCVVGVVLLFLPSVRKAIFSKGSSSDSKKNLNLIFANKVLGIVGVILIQYAIAVGSATVVNGLAGMQYALMFLFILLLTKFRPKTFSEKFTKRELMFEVSAIALTIIGLLYLSN